MRVPMQMAAMKASRHDSGLVFNVVNMLAMKLETLDSDAVAAITNKSQSNRWER